MDELAHFGLVIDPPTAGADASVRSLQNVGKAADDLTAKLNKLTEAVGHKTRGAFDAHTSAMQRMLGPASALLRALGPLGDSSLLMASRFERAAAALDQMEVAGSKAGASIGKLIAITGGVIGVLAGLALAIFAVKKAWDFLKESVIAAGKQQQEAFSFQFLIGNANLALAKLNELKAFWQSSGVFQFGDLTKAATNLTLVGVGTNNLIERIKEMGAVAIGTQGTIEGVVRAYDLLRKSATENTAPPVRGGGSIEMLGLMKALQAETHLTGDALQKAFTEGRISIDTVNKALRDSTTAGGIFAGSIEAYRKTWAGSTQALGTAWDAFKEKVGAPIVNVLTPLIQKWTTQLSDMGATGDAAGEGIARWIVEMDTAIQQHNFGNALAKSIISGIKASGSLFDHIWDESALQLHDAIRDAAIKAWDDFTAYTKNNIMPWLRAADLSKTGLHGAGSSWEPDLPSDKVKPNLLNTLTSPGTDDAIIKQKQLFESDAEIMAKFTVLQGQLNAAVDSGTISQTEYNYRLLQLQDATTKALGNPEMYAKALGDFRTYEEARIRAAQEADRRLASGEASTMEAISTGLRKTMHDWGTWDQMVAKSAGDVANAISNDIGTALDSLIDGTKTLGQAFSDMAVGILRDIAKIIERMLIQYAIQQLLAGFGIGGSVSSTPNESVHSAGAMATGGHITGGSGLRDDVPAMLTAGEYVFSKPAVDRAGGASVMDRWHEAAKSGRARGFDDGGFAEPGPLRGTSPGPGYFWTSSGWVSSNGSYSTAGSPTYDPYYGRDTPSWVPYNVGSGGFRGFGAGSSTWNTWDVIHGIATPIGSGLEPMEPANNNAPLPGAENPGGITASGADPYPYTGLAPAHLTDNSSTTYTPPPFDYSSENHLGTTGLGGLGAGVGNGPTGTTMFGDLSAAGYSVGPMVSFGFRDASNWGGGRGNVYGAMISGTYGLLANKGGYVPSFATGGTMMHDGLAQLHKGEKISTPQQWESIKSSAGNQTNVNTAQVSIEVNYNGDGTADVKSKSAGNAENWRQTAKAIQQLVDKRIQDQVRTGGYAQNLRR